MAPEEIRTPDPQILTPAEKPAEFPIKELHARRLNAMGDIRILLKDRVISDLSTPKSRQYRARDTQLKGFHIVIGRRTRIFAVQGDRERMASVSPRSPCGSAMLRRCQHAKHAERPKSYLAQISKGEHPDPKPIGLAVETNEAAAPNREATIPSEHNAAAKGVTLVEAWERYRDAHLNRSGGTIEGYRDHVERLLKDWLATPLLQLADDPAKVIGKQ
ncbi:hypothetical protein ACWTU6_19830 [Mesorhizobium sp. BHbsci]